MQDAQIRKLEAEAYLKGWNDCLRTTKGIDGFVKNHRGRPRHKKRKTDKL